MEQLDPEIGLPLSINEKLYDGCEPKWLMTNAERCALIRLVSAIKPRCAIEVGTAHGGSLSVIAQFSQQVYSLDIDPTCPERLGHKFSNVEFVTGPSHKTLPPLLKNVQQAGVDLEFVLIDGDHTRDGVKSDIEELLVFRPTRPLYVLMHGSFNPLCREGIAGARWSASPYVHFVELDFIQGISDGREMWGGLALAYLLPVERTGDLKIQAWHERLFQSAFQQSIYRHRLHTWLNAFGSAARQRVNDIVKR